AREAARLPPPHLRRGRGSGGAAAGGHGRAGCRRARWGSFPEMNLKLALVALCGCAASPSTASLDGPLMPRIGGADAPRPAAPPPDARPPDARPDARPPDAPDCGAPCPTGFHCGSANGLAVCRHDDSGIPLFSNVFVVLMENLSFNELLES